MCKNGFLLLGLLCGLMAAFSARAENKPFSDDFKGVSRALPSGEKKLMPDPEKWAFTLWPGTQWPDSYGDGTNWLEGNAESQVYLNPFLAKVKGKAIPADLRYNPFNIDGQGLHIRADVLTKEQQAAHHVGGHRRFGSGMLLSQYSFTYGRVDVVAKLPNARGSWPAIWLLPQKRVWPPEIDILEGMSWGNHKTQIHSGLIPAKEDGIETYADWFDVGVDPSQDFHTYSLEWTKDTLSMMFDGREIWRKPTPPSMNQPMYLIINLAVGGKWPYNEAGIKPVDSIEPERLLRGANAIEADYPAEMIIKSVSIK